MPTSLRKVSAFGPLVESESYWHFQPQCVFKPSGLIVEGPELDQTTIRDIRIGYDSMFASEGELPASMFAAPEIEMPPPDVDLEEWLNREIELPPSMQLQWPAIEPGSVLKLYVGRGKLTRAGLFGYTLVQP